MIRNRTARGNAMILRSRIAAVLADRSQLDAPLTDKQLHRALGIRCISVSAVSRHRRWVQEQHALGELPKLLIWIQRARTERYLPDWPLTLR